MLFADGLVSGYGDVEVLHGVSLTVREGEVVALVGSNGAGKTTLLRTLVGLLGLRTGSIQFGGRDVSRFSAQDRVRGGIALVPEGRRLFSALSVEQNLQLGAYLRRDQVAVKDDLARIYEHFPILRERRNQAAGSLSGGEQQMCTIGRALMSGPRLLLIDELSLGLSPVAVDGLLIALRALHTSGMTFLMVEQDVETALQFADRGYVLEAGEIVLEGPSAELLANPSLRSAYLGI
jgi:branched-chain amino acid transport system ATP-binding protein